MHAVSVTSGMAHSGSKADDVVARLGEILADVDMAITTQRQITNKLAEELGEEVYEYKALIRVSKSLQQATKSLLLHDLDLLQQIRGESRRLICRIILDSFLRANLLAMH